MGQWNFFTSAALFRAGCHPREPERFMASTKEAGATIEDIQHDLHSLRDDLARLAQQVTGLVSETGDEAIGAAKKRMRKLRENLDETVSDAGERGREALSDVSENIGEALEESLREHPLTTVALAVGLGFLFGTAWRR
jgi:ElaB/YqjD/DUF883 family membrane-anchored ribosome-binding protein